MYEPKYAKDIRCPLEYGLKVFGGKWKSRIICVLAEKKKLRYSALRRDMANISDAILAATLKELIADQLVAREQFNEIPPRVEYRLTEKGESVVPILQSICRWPGCMNEISLRLIRCRSVSNAVTASAAILDHRLQKPCAAVQLIH